jgi:hypothetical protein
MLSQQAASANMVGLGCVGHTHTRTGVEGAHRQHGPTLGED